MTPRRAACLLLIGLLISLLGAGCRASPSARSGTPAVPPPGLSPGTTAITFLTSPVAPGGKVTVRAYVPARAACALSVTDSHGAAVATPGAGTAHADAVGNASWVWVLDVRATPGTYRAVISCTPGASVTSNFQVS